MMAEPAEQRNVYKGSPPRPWIQLCLTAPDGSTHEMELLADTGNPCAIILGEALMARLKQRTAPDLQSNFGLLQGGCLHFAILGLGYDVVGFASDAVVTATEASRPDFKGLVGLPLLRLLEYGGDADCFWVRSIPSQA